MSPNVGNSLSPSEKPTRFNSKRVYSALVFIPLFYLLTQYLPPIFFFGLTLIVSCLAMWEFYGLAFFDENPRLPSIVGLTCGILLLFSLQSPDWISFKTAIVIILFVLTAYQVVLVPLVLKSLSHLPFIFFGVVYIALTLGHLLLLRKLPDGPLLVFFVLLVSWGGDAAAYYSGKSFGSRPLAPILSPKKTIEGLVGGLIAAPLIAWGTSLWFLPLLTPIDCIILGLALTFLGIVGDLSESAFKRQAGAKDSGNLIPGHGGFLDRIDSLLLTVPTFYYYMLIVKGLVPIS